MAALCITYYNGRLHFYNHNTVLMLCVVACRGHVLAGLAHAQTVLVAAARIEPGLGQLEQVSDHRHWFVHPGGLAAAARLARPDAPHGPAVGTLIALLMVVPHLYWLAANDFGPVHYAMNSSLGVDMMPVARLTHVANWLLDVVMNRMLPAWLLLGFAIVAVRHGPNPAFRRDRDRNSRQSRRLGAVASLVVRNRSAAVHARCGTSCSVPELQLQWGTAFVPFAVPRSWSCGLGIERIAAAGTACSNGVRCAADAAAVGQHVHVGQRA